MPQIADVDLSLTDGLLLLALAPVCAYLAYQLYKGRGDGAPRSLWLMALRGVAFLLLLALLAEPILALRVTGRRRPLVAVLADDSESMRTPDGGIPRSEIVGRLLDQVQAAGTRAGARLAHYRFSEKLAPLAGRGADTLRWDGRATDLAGALDGLKQASPGEGLVAAVLVTDGGHNYGGSPERAARALGVPVIAVGVGDPEPPVDVAVTSATVDPLGYTGQDLVVQAGIRSSGLNGRTRPVTVRQGSLTVAAQAVRLDDGEQLVSFSVRPERAGHHVFRIGVARQEGEVSEANNSVLVTSEVLDSHRRVLIAGGRPSADLAYLRRLLASDPDLEVHLETAVSGTGTSPGIRAALSRPGDWDLVVLVDVPSASLADEPARALSAFLQAGGGLLVVGGPSAWDVGYAAPGLAGLLPLRPARKPSTYVTGPYQVTPLHANARHPILRLSEDPIADREAWAELPPLLACNLNLGAAAGAVVLLAHGSERVAGGPLPLAAAMTVGRGKAMGVAFRTFWRHALMMWGVGKTDRVSRAFWTQAVRWLVTPEDSDRVKVATDKRVYRSGETVTVRARVVNALQQPIAGAQVRLVSDGNEAAFDVRMRDEGGGRYVGQLSAGDQGEQTFKVQAVSGDSPIGSADGRFTVGRYSLEHEDVRMNAELLRAVASASGGEFTTPDSLATVLADLPLNPQVVTRDHRWRLWGRTWPLFVLVLLLAVEWTVRRSRGMI